MTTVIGLSRRPGVVLGIASAAGLAAFAWPLMINPSAGAGDTTAPFLFLTIVPVLIVVMLAELTAGGIDARAVAMLGVLSAVGAALRPLGAGTAGVELVFFLLVLAGRVYGPAFGFVLGATTLFSSALLTAGVGPWLPYQMLAAGWVGLGAGLLPARLQLRGRAEIALLIAYGVFASLAYGFLLNLSFWPYALGNDTQLSYLPGGGLMANLHRFVLFTIATSSLGWDTGRAITNAIALAVLGPAVLVVLRRAARRAAFDVPVDFSPAPSSDTRGGQRR